MDKLSLSTPVFLLMHGAPGTGKSFFARRYVERHQLIHINSDRIRYELYDDPKHNVYENNTVLRLADYFAQAALGSGQGLIFDMHLPTKSLRRQMLKLAQTHNALYLTVWVQTDRDTARQRSLRRDRRRPDDRFNNALSQADFDRMASALSRPDEPTIVISGKHAFSAQAQTVDRRLQTMGVLKPRVLSGRFDASRRRPKRES